MQSSLIAKNEISALVRDKTLWVLFAVFVFMTLISAFIGWSSQHTVQEVYSASAAQLRAQGTDIPPSPLADSTPLSLDKNMIIYTLLIGVLMAICMGHNAGMRERKASVMKIIFSRPISKLEFFTGKILGLGAIILVTMLLAAVITTATSLLLTGLSAQYLLNIFGFYVLSFIYLCTFAMIGFSFALVMSDETIALLIPIIIWLSFTFVIPEFTLALYPTGSLNPVMPVVSTPHEATLNAIANIVKPFSLVDHYKEAGGYFLQVSGSAWQDQLYHIGAILAWFILSLAACVLVIKRFNPAVGDLNA